MSYFDGIIPEACRDCFHWDGTKWVQTEPGLCDNCEYMLDMFPLIDKDKRKERERWRLLADMDEPVWHIRSLLDE